MQDPDFCEGCGREGKSALCPMCRSLRTAKEQLNWPPEGERQHSSSFAGLPFASQETTCLGLATKCAPAAGQRQLPEPKEEER